MLDETARKDDGATGPDMRRSSLSLSGEGVSSMMRTQPDVFPTGVFGLSLSTSKLSRLVLDIMGFSGEWDRKDDLELDAEGEVTLEGPALGGIGGTY